MEKIWKDVGDIQARMMDHRPITQGEIRYFVREFEEKRGYREVRVLEKLDKVVEETSQVLLPQCSQNMQQHLFQALTRLEAANHMTQRIQQRELEAQQSPYMQASLERRREDWEEFLKEQQSQKEQVDEEHAKAVGRLSCQYSDMKKDLAKFSHF